MKNIGFDHKRELAEQTDEDIRFGSTVIDGLANEVAGLVGAVYAWPNPVNGVYPRVEHGFNHAINIITETKYLPDGTVQRGKEDWMNCASNAPNNEIEKQHNYALVNGLFSDSLVKWFDDNGYLNNGKFETSDAFTAIGSGTTKTGNSLKSPIVFLEKNGVIPKWLLPDDKSMNFDQYHNPNRITQEMKDLSEEYCKRIKINYKRKSEYTFQSIIVAPLWKILDSYIDPVDGNFVKDLATDYQFYKFGYKLYIRELKVKVKKNKICDFLTLLRAFLSRKIYRNYSE